MHSNANNVVAWVALVGVVLLGAVVLFSSGGGEKSPSAFGAAGNLLAEQYDPYIMYNGGFTTGKEIKQTQTSGTSTLSVGCIEAFATSSATQVKIIYNAIATSTTISGDTVAGHVLWGYGSCPN